MHTMKSFKLLFVLFITLFYSLISHSSYLIAQIYKPVKWSYSVNKLSGNKAELVFTAKIEKNWYLYSQDIPKVVQFLHLLNLTLLKTTISSEM